MSPGLLLVASPSASTTNNIINSFIWGLHILGKQSEHSSAPCFSWKSCRKPTAQRYYLCTLTLQDLEKTWQSCIQWHEVSNDTFDIVFDKIRNWAPGFQAPPIKWCQVPARRCSKMRCWKNKAPDIQHPL